MISKALFAAALLHASSPALAQQGFDGPDAVEVDLLRTIEGGSRVYVQATLPDGELGLFMIDTGAATSVLSMDTARRLGLAIERNWGTLEGLGGTAPFHRAELPTLALGDAVVRDVEVAVGVRGVPDEAGAMPLDGILGNNVLAHFLLELDYPADLMVLHRHGTRRMPRRSSPMLFQGGHVLSTLELRTPSHTGRVFTQIDTGASGLVLSGSTGAGFEEDATEGLEPVYGIGASEILPPSVFLQTTRRIPIEAARMGGRKVDLGMDARWLNFSGGRAVGPQGMRGLAGHELMSDHVALFDYDGQAFALVKSRRKARQLNGHARLLGQDEARYGDDPARYLFRARLLVWMDEPERATTKLEAYLESHPHDAEARVLLAGMRRLDSDLEGAWEALTPLTPDELVEEHEIVAAVNGLVLEGRPAEALALADAAVSPEQSVGDEAHAALLEMYSTADADEVEARQKTSWAHVARADVLLAMGRLDEANDALLAAAELVENPDAHLLRRARVAMARGDLHGSLAHVRRLLQLYPSMGQFLWYYSLLVDDEAERETFRADLEDAVSRLHPTHLPLDFMVAAYWEIGEHDRARDLMAEGVQRDCEAIDFEPSHDNCVAWYSALARHHTDAALRLVDDALAAEGDRSDFLDTKAVVHLVRGEYDQAYASALAAARMSPEDIYMLWQADRIGQLAAESFQEPP